MLCRRLTVVRPRLAMALLVGSALSWSVPLSAVAQFSRAVPAEKTRCVIIEAFIREDSPRSSEARKYLDKLAESRQGLHLVYRDVASNEAASRRLVDISKYFQVTDPVVPTVYMCRQIITGFQNEGTTGRQIEDLLKVEVYVREGCPRCARTKAYLSAVEPRYPGLKFVYREIISDPVARADWEATSRRHGVVAPGIPTFHAFNKVIVGFDGEQITGGQYESLLQSATFPCPPAKSSLRPGPRRSGVRLGVFRTSAIEHTSVRRRRAGERESPPPPIADAALESDDNRDGPPAPLATDGPPPPEFGELDPMSEAPETTAAPTPGETKSDSAATEAAPVGDSAGVNVPFIGRVRAADVGLPTFTLAVGLIDGFNPCAMWVLLFLLSVLINLKSRWKILAVAGTFVLVSGAVYFAFMAAWLNFYLVVGYLRSVQVILGLLGIFVGLVNVKDFFAFKKGITFSIPDSARTSINDRLRRIVSAENLIASMIGAIVLAVLVNIVELLCTAGLPAMYTAVLSQQNFPTWKKYAYLLLYNAAYMFDDAIMVGIVVITMNRRRLQESEGRYLKAFSGAVILCFGVVMLAKPEWLV